MDDDSEREQKKWYHFDIRNTPCARKSLMSGIVGGGACGIIHYLRRGVVLKACDVAVGGFVVSTLIIWAACRYEKAKMRANIKRTVKIMNNANSENNTNSDNKNQ